MENQRQMLANAALERTAALQTELYRTLRGRPVTPETLAEALERHFPDQDPAQRTANCRRLLEGLEQGRAEFRRLDRLPESSLDGELARQVEQRLERLDPAARRQYLILLLQVLYNDSGRNVDANLSVYLSNLPGEELEKQLSFLIAQKGKELVGQAAASLSQVMPELKNLPPEAAERSRTEQEQIAAAAVYASMQQGQWKILAAEQVGRQVGFESSFWEQLGQAVRQQALPAAVRLLAIAAIAAGGYFALQLPLVSEAVALILGLLEKNQMTKAALLMLVPVIGKAWDWLDQRLYAGPAVTQAIDAGQDASAQLDAYFTRTQRLADCAAQPPVVEEIVLTEEETLPENVLLEEEPPILL